METYRHHGGQREERQHKPRLRPSQGRHLFPVYFSITFKVLSAKTQVVAGLNYDLQVEFGQSSCTKDTAELNSSNCPATANGPTKVRHIFLV